MAGYYLTRMETVPPPIGTKMTDQPEHGAQDPRLCLSVGTGGRDGVGDQDGSAKAAEVQENGYSDIRDAEYM